MVRKIIPLNKLDTTKIWVGEAKAGGGTLEDKTRVRMGIYASKDMDELLLRTDLGVGGEKRECKAYGFRDKNGTFTIPLVIGDDVADALDEIAIELEKRMSLSRITPVYRYLDGNRVYARVIMSKGGVVFSQIHDRHSEVVRPEDKTGAVMDVRGVIRVDSVFFGDIPRIQISLIEAEVTDSEMSRETLLQRGKNVV